MQSPCLLVDCVSRLCCHCAWSVWHCAWSVYLRRYDVWDCAWSVCMRRYDVQHQPCYCVWSVCACTVVWLLCVECFGGGGLCGLRIITKSNCAWSVIIRTCVFNAPSLMRWWLLDKVKGWTSVELARWGWECACNNTFLSAFEDELQLTTWFQTSSLNAGSCLRKQSQSCLVPVAKASESWLLLPVFMHQPSAKRLAKHELDKNRKKKQKKSRRSHWHLE